MIQRKQTIFLFLSFVILIICLCMPIGSIAANGMLPANKMTNLWIVSANGVKDFKVWPLFAILLATLPLHLFTIIDYKKRKRQAAFCVFIILLIVLWFLAYLLISQIILGDLEYHIDFTSFLPCISIVLLILARRAIKADEALVRAADRIR
ncbi:DUF4293 domain-containing protein [Prevotella nigrescens]|uniref:DUF4293 domain-containing protein n=1 Tax=Prevotella nigrescens TaxID=28133 RepID=UPI000F2B0B52|nr:DUF4293 domain-containing protein [Prevotella nigrescens]RKW51766.1 MAG: DUF4293 family protein [Prevotella sp.]